MKYVTNEKGKKVSVVIPVSLWEAIIDDYTPEDETLEVKNDPDLMDAIKSYKKGRRGITSRELLEKI